MSLDNGDAENHGRRLYGEQWLCAFCGAKWPRAEGWECHRCKLCEHGSVAATCPKCEIVALRTQLAERQSEMDYCIDLLDGNEDEPGPQPQSELQRKLLEAIANWGSLRVQLAEARNAMAWREHLWGHSNKDNRLYSELPEEEKEIWRKEADRHTAELIKNGAFARAALAGKKEG